MVLQLEEKFGKIYEGPVSGIGAFFASAIGFTLGLKKNERSVAHKGIEALMTKVGQHYMLSEKRELLFCNLHAQRSTSQNKYTINQIKGSGNFSLNISQVFDPSISSQFEEGFFDLNDGTGSGAVVDFAHKHFGGGVLNNGFVQEEKMLLETNLLEAVGDNEYSGLHYSPLLIEALQTHEFVGDGKKLYGNSGINGLNQSGINTQNVDGYLRKKERPEKVNIVAMAAIDVRGFDKYKMSNLKQMFLCAYKGFKAHKDNGGKEIHTGAWGAGVFGNSENVTCVIQILAAQAAGIQLYYHGKEEPYHSAIRLLKGGKGKSYENIFSFICDDRQNQHGNDFWKMNKQ